jgi:hypothetical protein
LNSCEEGKKTKPFFSFNLETMNYKKGFQLLKFPSLSLELIPAKRYKLKTAGLKARQFRAYLCK